MNRSAQAVIMLLFSGTILKISITDVHLRYVKGGLRPFLIAAGLVLVAAAVMTLVHEWRRATADAVDTHGHRGRRGGRRGDAHDGGHDDGHDDGHGHAHGHEPRIGWLLLLPALALLLMAPPALGSYAAGQAGTISVAQQSDSDAAPLPPGDVVPLGLREYAWRALGDGGRSLTGRKVRLVGFVTPDPDGKPMLARIVMSCCAADGRPIKIGLAGDAPGSVAPDTWIEVVGTYTDKTARDPVNDEAIPYLEVTSWAPTTAPEQQYE